MSGNLGLVLHEDFHPQLFFDLRGVVLSVVRLPGIPLLLHDLKVGDGEGHRDDGKENDELHPVDVYPLGDDEDDNNLFLFKVADSTDDLLEVDLCFYNQFHLPHFPEWKLHERLINFLVRHFHWNFHSRPKRVFCFLAHIG